MLRKQNEIGIKGILSLINCLIKDFGNDGEVPTEYDVTFPKEGKEYTFVFGLRDEKKNIRVSYNENISQVRWRVGYYFDIPINALALIAQKKVVDMNDDFKLFRELFSPIYQIDVKLAKHPILMLKNNPKSILMRDTKLSKILYELLYYPDSGRYKN